MILYEIDYDYSFDHAQQEVSRVQQAILSGAMSPDDALLELNNFTNQLTVEITLSELNKYDKFRFRAIFLFIRLAEKDIIEYKSTHNI